METQIAPGPRGHFIFGSLPERQRDPLKLFMRGALRYGDVVRFRMFSKFVYLIVGPDELKHVLQDNHKNYIKGFGYDKMEPVLGKGLLTSEGDFWRRQRKLSQPAFHRQRLVDFSTTMVAATERMMQRWEKLAESNETIDISAEMMRLTMEIVGLTLLSSDVTSHADSVGASLSVLLEEANRRITSIFRLSEHFPTPEGKRFQRAKEHLDEIVLGMIRDRRRTGEDKGDLLSMLMAARDEDTGEQMTDAQLRDEVMTIFLAGHETTANAMAWTWYLLSKNPIIADRLHAEVDGVLKNANGLIRAPEFEDLPKLSYTNRVLEESMRLYPPAWVFSREAIGPDVLGGYAIKPGNIVIISPYVLHRSPKYWSNPEGFDPDRFLPEAVASRSKYAYLPFSAGPRQCIGSNFAMMEAQLILSAVSSRFELHLIPGYNVEPEALITLRPKGGLKMKIRRR